MQDSRQSNTHLYILIFFVAICSILYEFILASTLAVIFGNTILRYNITIGFYIASMGVGSLIHGFLLKNTDEDKKFVYTELALAILGSITPVLILLLDWLNRNYFNTPNLIFIIVHFFICLIGIITGFEIPIVLELAKKKYSNLLNKLLFFDYIGTFSGSLLFPLVLIHNFQLFNIGFITSIVNCIIGIYSIYCLKTNSKKMIYSFITIIIINIILIYSSFGEYIVRVLYE